MNRTKFAAVVIGLATAGLSFVPVTQASAATVAGTQSASADSFVPESAPTGCDQHPAPGQVACFAVIGQSHATPPGQIKATPSIAGDGTNATPFSASDLWAINSLPSQASAQPSATSPLVAVVDAYSDPNVKANLDYYRSQMGLSALPEGDFTEVNQSGDASPLPAYDADWAGESNLDVQMVSAICPACRILLVSTDSPNSDDIAAGIQTAENDGAGYISMSLGVPEVNADGTQNTFLRDQAPYSDLFASKNTLFAAATGDWGYGANWPATASNVVGVGGDSVYVDSNGNATLQAWDDDSDGSGSASSGCSVLFPQPSAQSGVTNLSGVCGDKAVSDVSDVADPKTPVYVYMNDGSGIDPTDDWYGIGGTSAAAPIIASMYALAGNNTDPFAVYNNDGTDPTTFRDVTAGGPTENCDGTILCEPTTGWDGPTGLGLPNGLGAFTPSDNSGSAPTAPVADDDRATVRAGKSVTINVLSNDSFTGNADIALGTVPTGLTATVADSNTVTLTVAANVKNGTVLNLPYTLSDDSGLAPSTANIQVTVVGAQAPSLGAIHVSITGTHSISLGKSFDWKVTPATTVTDSNGAKVAVNGLTIRVTGLPKGVTNTAQSDGSVTFSGKPTAITHGTLKVTVTGTATTGESVSGKAALVWKVGKRTIVVSGHGKISGDLSASRAKKREVTLSAVVPKFHNGTKKGQVIYPLYTIQWLLDGKPVKGCWGPKVHVKASVKGHKVSFKVTAYDSGYKTLTWTSKAVKIK